MDLRTKFSWWWNAVMLCMLAIFAGTAQPAADETASASCSAPEFRQFNFWVGNWDVYEMKGSTKVAKTRVDRILDGCVIHERYERPSKGLIGESFSIYDASTKMWRQSWVTNQGENLIIEGTLQNGEMILTGTDHANNAIVRTVWKPVSDGVRETAVTSTDNGKTWQPSFDLLFRSAAAEQ